MELEVAPEHAQQVFFQAHHQRMHPGVKQHVGTFEAHLRRVARREILHMDRGGDHRAGQAQALGDVALHLRAQHQLDLQLGDMRFDLQVVVADQCLDAVKGRRLTHVAREFTAVGAQADDLEAEFGGRHPGRRDGMRRVAEDKHALGRQVVGIDRFGVPG